MRPKTRSHARFLALLALGWLASTGCESSPSDADLGADTLRAIVSDTALAQGTYAVVVAPVYELANIALSRTRFGRASTFLIEKRTAYHAEVDRHFRGADGHALVRSIEPDPDAWIRDYYGLRDNAYRYALDADAVIPRSGYAPLWEPDLVADERGRLAAYAAETGFRDFFEARRGWYQEYADAYRRAVPVGRMWGWLESHFPARHQRYTVVLSPLVGGSHSTTTRARPDGAREVLMFIAGLDAAVQIADPALRSSVLERIVFTEIDHNYVNPVTEQHGARVDAALGAWARWNSNPGGGGYGSARATFNEYMTWAVFSLYLLDHYAPADAARAVAELEQFMERGRLFPRFTAFDRELIRLYQARAPGQRVADLYPALLTWVEAQR